MNLLQFLPNVVHYLQQVNLDSVPEWCSTSNFTVYPLAQGEYNMNYIVRKGGKQQFITCYKNAITDRHLADTIFDRVKLRDPFNYLRGRSWSALAWITYQTDDHALKNQDTFNKVCTYLDIDFQREMFDPYLKNSTG